MNPKSVTAFFNDKEKWTPDQLAFFSAIYHAMIEEKAMKEGEEELGRVLNELATKIIGQIPPSVREGKTCVEGTMAFENEYARKIKAGHDYCEGHDGILKRLEKLLPQAMRSTDHKRVENKGLRVWFNFKEASNDGLSVAQASIRYRYDWSAPFKKWSEDAKRNLALYRKEKKKRAAPTEDQANAKRAKVGSAEEVVAKPEQP